MRHLLLAAILLKVALIPRQIHSFTTCPAAGKANVHTPRTLPLSASREDIQTNGESGLSRRGFLAIPIPLAMGSILTINAHPSDAAGNFTPGGTLVDREVGATVGNPEASPTRKLNNENVLFSQDNYFKFGVAAPWIEPDTTDFPKTMPFVLSQQRYDSLKKYGDRVSSGAVALKDLDSSIKGGNYATIAGCNDSIYALRPLGLLANGFLGSENTGTTNELLLARWYINEVYLRIGDIQNAASEAEAMNAYNAAIKAFNSYFSMLNRVINSKVGNKFDYL